MERKEAMALVTTVNEKEFRFEMPIGATFTDAYVAAHECLVEITEMVKKYNESLEKKAQPNEENK